MEPVPSCTGGMYVRAKVKNERLDTSYAFTLRVRRKEEKPHNL
jgi:hypothetical protein